MRTSSSTSCGSSADVHRRERSAAAPTSPPPKIPPALAERRTQEVSAQPAGGPEVEQSPGQRAGATGLAGTAASSEGSCGHGCEPARSESEDQGCPQATAGGAPTRATSSGEPGRENHSAARRREGTHTTDRGGRILPGRRGGRRCRSSSAPTRTGADDKVLAADDPSLSIFWSMILDDHAQALAAV